MKYQSTLLAQGSGSLGGCTYSHNRYGKYIRNRSIPVNPNSTPQQSIRMLFANCAIAWNMELTTPQRDSWDLYAANVPKIDKLGMTIHITGFNWYLAVNSLRLYVNKPRIDQAPSTFNMTDLTPLTASGDAATGVINVVFNNTDEWATTSNGFLAFFIGNATNSTVLFYAGPFTRTPTVISGAATPPTSPASVPSGVTLVATQLRWLRAIACSGDGRLSVPQILRFISV